MKAKVQIGRLSEAIQHASVTIDKGSKLASSYVYLKAQGKPTDKEQWLYVYSTDLKSSLLMKIPATVITEGETLVRPELLRGQLLSLPKEGEMEISLINSNKQLQTTYAKMRSRLATSPEASKLSSSITGLLGLAQKPTCVAPASTFADLLSKMGEFTSDEPSRVSLTGVKLTHDKDGFTAYASDGIVMAKAQVAGGKGDFAEVIIPGESIKEIVSIMSKHKDEDVEFHTLSNAGGTHTGLLFKLKTVIYTTGILAAKFPNIQPVIDKVEKYKRTVTFSRSDLLATITRCRQFQEDKVRSISLEVGEKTLTVLAGDSAGQGDFQDELTILEDNAVPPITSVTMGLNLDYLAMSLSGSKNDLMKMSINAPNEAVYLKDTVDDASKSYYIISPMRI